MDRKTRISQLASDVVRSTSREALSIRELVALLIEDTKDALVSSDGSDTLRLQGQATGLAKLHRLVSTAPTNIKPPVQSERTT